MAVHENARMPHYGAIHRTSIDSSSSDCATDQFNYVDKAQKVITLVFTKHG